MPKWHRAILPMQDSSMNASAARQPLPNVLLLRVRGKLFHREPGFVDKLLLLGRSFQVLDSSSP
jgi:hypothetical protein